MEPDHTGVIGVPVTPTPEAVLTAVAPPLTEEQRDLIMLDTYRRMGAVDERTKLLVGQVGDHESRMRSLEKRQWSIPGLSAIVAVLAALGLHPHGL